MKVSPAGSQNRTACDVLLVGGGLANSLIALELRSRRPELRVIMLERAARSDTSHTWCVFRRDLSDRGWRTLSGLFANVWPGYDVAFPEHRRRIDTTYARLTEEGLAAAVDEALGADLIRSACVGEITPSSASCEDGRTFDAPLVIDGRGFAGSSAMRLAYQKFVGLEVELQAPHGLDAPMMMDATVPQLDGYRFLYVLPLAPRRLLIEDTRYSDGPALDLPGLGAEVRRYAEKRGWTIVDVQRQESGVLPIVLGGDISAFWARTVSGVPTVGVAGAFFHPTTGYSLPHAARVAEAIADCPRLVSGEVRPLVERMSKALWADGGFYRRLNRMMFEAAEPDRRYAVLQRFYRLSKPLIERFYARRLTLIDKMRILTGRPPVPFGRALRVVARPQGDLRLA